MTLRLWQLLQAAAGRAEGDSPSTRRWSGRCRRCWPRWRCTGIKVDRDQLSRLSDDFAQRMAELEDEIHELAGQPFNLGSPKQIGEMLFDEMGLAGGKKTKTGA